MEGNRHGCDSRVYEVGSSTISSMKTPNCVSTLPSTAYANVSNTPAGGSLGKATLDKDDSMSLTTTETSTISTDNIGSEQEQGHDRQEKEGASSKDLVEETCFECSTKFLLSLQDAIVTEVALCVQCRKEQMKIEQSIANEGKKTRAAPVAKPTRKSSSSKKFTYEEDVAMDIDSRDDNNLMNNACKINEYRGSIAPERQATGEQIHHNGVNSSSYSLPSRFSEPKNEALKADVIHKMREENLIYIFDEGNKDERDTPVIDVDSSKICKSRPRRKSQPRSLKELLGADR